MATDEDLKLSDTLRYYMKDFAAAKDLLYSRARSLADYENANKALEKARLKNKEVAQVDILWHWIYSLYVVVACLTWI